MMHLKITDEIRERCLREAAHDARINDRIVTSTPADPCRAWHDDARQYPRHPAHPFLPLL